MLCHRLPGHVQVRAESAERLAPGVQHVQQMAAARMHDNISDWKTGSPWTHKRTDAAGTVDIAGEVVESDPPRRLVLSWAPPKDAGNPAKTSRVTFELEPQDWPGGPWVQLRVLHTELEPDSEMFHSVSYGWPALMSGLKTILESRGRSQG